MVLSKLSNYKSIDNTHFYIDRIHKMKHENEKKNTL